MDLLSLSRTRTDRAGDQRTVPGLLERLRADPTTRVLLARDGAVATTPDGSAVAYLAAPEAGALAHPGIWAFLGYDDADQLPGAAPGEPAPAGPAYLALLVDEAPLSDPLAAAELRDGEPVDVAQVDVAPDPVPAPEGTVWSSLRLVGAVLDDRDAGLATMAVALAGWHARHRRCPRCGAATDPVSAGWVRRCEQDGTEHYPRTDPAVIMAVVDDGDRLLLARSARWPAGRYTVLAGFVEPGESAEHAIRREVREETAVVVDEVDYRGSQPWPFPASLMLAFRAHAATTRITVDGQEIAEAGWYTRQELWDAIGAGQVLLPMRSSIARALVEDWYGGTVPGGW